MNVHQSRETKGRLGQRELDRLIGAVGGAREVEDIYPLSGLQQGLLFHSLYAPQSAVYVVSVTCRLGGPLDVAAFHRAWQHVVERHAVLRTAFVGHELDRPVQVVRRRATLPFELHDWRGVPPAEQDQRFAALLAEDRARGFDFAAPPLTRLHLMRLAEAEWRLIWNSHHILFDGWSLPVLLDEVLAGYAAFSQGETPRLARVRPFRDYIGWLQRQDMAAAQTWWRDRLAGFTAPTALGIDRLAAAAGIRYAEHDAAVPIELAELESFARRHKLTVNTLVQGAWALLLARYADSDDVVFGVTVAGRPAELPEVERTVGLFINTLPLRLEVPPGQTVADWLHTVQARQTELIEHQYSPLSDVQRCSELPSGTALFDSIVAFENYPAEMAAAADITRTIRITEVRPVERTNYPLTLQVALGAALSLRLIYDADRFAADAIARMVGHFTRLLGGLIADPARPLSTLSPLDATERRQLIAPPADRTSWRQDRCLHELFAGQAARTPDAVALSCADETLSYGELDSRANRLAHHLRSLGVGPDVVVGLCVERSLDMVVGLLAILKAGGAYLPLDPGLPPDRLAYMLADARAPVLITQDVLAELLPESEAVRIRLDADAPAIARQPATAPDSGADPLNLAYVIYTSGSTGRPKGTLVTHDCVTRLFAATDSWFGFGPHDVWTLFHSFAFDFSVWELFGALLHGGRLVIVPYWVSRSPEQFHALLAREAVTVLNQTPSAFAQLVRADAAASRELALRLVIFGGEALNLAELAPWFERHGDTRPQLVNMYGITETTVHVTFRPVRMADLATGTSPIGTPIPDLQLHVLDRHREPLPLGVAGEMHIGGAGLARGYLGRPALTAERFVPSPFAPGERLYRTGDLARRTTDGELDYLGRIDHQVKIRGFRIEPGEIEAALMAHPAIDQAAVLARQDAGDRRLVAYVVGRGKAAPDSSDLRRHLQQTLPDYMVPAAFVALDHLPLTTNGKLDRKALPAPEAHSGQTYVAPRNAAEQALAGILAGVLGLDRVGIDDNFFELGGDSLLATRAVARAQYELGADLPLRTLFEAPTVRRLAEFLRMAPTAFAPAMERVARDQPLPLSHAQERLWFLEQLGLVGGSYNIGLAVRLVGRLDIAALAAALGEVVRRHEALRTRFTSRDEAAVQVIDPPWPIALEPLAVTPDQAGEQARAIMQQRFDLAEDRLLRVALLRLAADQHVLVLAMHHVVSDGWSIGVLVREVEALYAAFARGQPSPLPELPVQYADYAVWQRRWLADGALERQLGYWTDQLAGAPAALELPTDRPRPAVPSFRGAVHHFTIDPARTAALANLARQDGATLFMLLLAAFQVLLARWSGQYDVVVGTPIAGRSRAETEGLIGFFVNMLALRSRLDGAASFRSVLHGVQAAALDAYAHQDLPFEKLVEALHPIRDLSREPIVQAVFALQNMPQQPTRMAGLVIEPFDTGPVPAKFDLELSMVEADGALAASVVYATDLFDAATIERLAGHFARLLDAIVADPERRIAELPLLGEAERRQLAAWTGTVAPFPEDRCLQDLFAAQAARTPDAPAVICEDRTLSYRELDRRANRLAHHLRALGVGPDVVVGLSITRSPDLVVGVLGILKAGGAYLPLDPGYPADRLAYMLADARVPVLLTQSLLVDRLPVHAATLVRLDADVPQIARWPDTPPPGAADPHHLAYVIYTSGSTGRPKGVMIPHRGAMNLAEAQLTRLPLGPADRILQFASISFDAAVWDLLMAWRAGAALVLADPHDLMPGEPLRELITRQRITTVLLPPSALAALPVAELSCLTTLLVGGEACAAEQLRPWLAGRTVLNAYGPTEASVCTTLFDCGPDERRPPIGRPLPNTRTYVLDERLEPVPIGVAGELFIGGAGLARGYLARPALSAERFVPNPFAPGERLYRTGDRARWRADGELEFLGRLDTQVKIRGFRIEPGEIEAALLAQPGIEHAIVIARDDAVGKRLVAYLVGRADAVADAGELRRKLQQTLPDYMLPAAFVTLDRLPLTPNGKLDRTALPAPEWNAGADYLAPRNPLETILAGLFAELLGINRVGVNDNFFEAGGDSIQSIQLVGRARAQGIVITPRQIFQHQTVAALAEVAGRSQAAPAPADTAAGPLTPIQQWFLAQPGPISHFNQAVLVEVPGDVKPALIEHALAALMNHHDALRSRFVRDGSLWRQDYLPVEGVQVDFARFDLADVGPVARIKQLQIAAARIQASLDPEAGRVAAAGWFDFGAAIPGRLLLVIHHLVVDGISWRILLEDLVTAYRQLAADETIRFPAKTTSVTAWAARLAARARAPVATDELAFWTAACHDAPALPRDRAGDGQCGTHGESETLTVTLSVPETQALLTAVPQAYRTRINDALLAALSLALADWRRARGDAATSVLVDLEGHGREDLFPGVDLSRTVGWFTSLYPVRLDPGPLDAAEVAAGGPAAGIALRRIKEQLRAVPHNGIGWGLLRHLNPESAGQLQALPRPQIAFNYLGRFEGAGDSGWRSAAESPGASVSPHRDRDHLLEVVALVQRGSLRTEFSWWPRAHDRASIADLAARATAALRGVIRHCTAAGAGGYTPSDFPLAQLDEDRLAALHRRYQDMEDVWPLAPMQHEILLHARHAPESRAGQHQLCLTLEGSIDPSALQQAWGALPARHAALRVAIADDAMAPRQVVRRSLQLPLRFADWSALPAEARERRVQDFLAQDRTQRFDLAHGPLLRGGLLRASPTRHMLVLSFHHIVLDGWSMPILLHELLELYHAARHGHSSALLPPPPYRDYLAWIAAIDRTAAEAFWRNRLASVEGPRLDLAAGDSAASPDALGERCVALSELSTSRLQTMAQARRLTMSTMVQGAWALLLARNAGDRDMVFGMTTAGRPGDLAGIERMVGLCINTLPRRVRPDPAARVADWLGDLQARQAEEQTYAWCTLDDIGRWSGAPAGATLFESVVVFENYPVGSSLAGPAVGEAPDLTVSAVTSIEQGVRFPLCLVVGPGSRLTLRLAFGHRRFAAEAIERLADDLVRLLTALAADPDQSVSALWALAGRRTTDQTRARVAAEVGAS